MSTGLIMFALIGGLIAYLIIEHSLIFWLLVLPILTFAIIKFILWLKK